jgi:probable blue pigment (indigoidine) exporter
MAGMATSVWLTRHWQIDLPEMALTGWQLALGGTMLAPAAWLFEAPLPMLTFTQCVAYTYLSLAGALIAYGLCFRLFRMFLVPFVSFTIMGLTHPSAQKFIFKTVTKLNTRKI